MDKLDEIRKQIHDRLAELRPVTIEYERLQQVHAALSGTQSAEDSAERRGRMSSAGPARPRRAPRGAARELILAAARDNPHAKRGDIAKITGLSPNTVGTTLSKLRAEGALPPSPRTRRATSEVEAGSAASENAPSSESPRERARVATTTDEPQDDPSREQQSPPPVHADQPPPSTGPADTETASARPAKRRTAKGPRPPAEAPSD